MSLSTTSFFSHTNRDFKLVRQSKKLYAWETGPVDDLALLLLCGEAEFKVNPELD